jgi:hypothetical protein
MLIKDMNNTKVDRWARDIASANLKIEHIPGPQNVLADAISRLRRKGLYIDESREELPEFDTNPGHIVVENIQEEQIHDQMMREQNTDEKCQLIRQHITNGEITKFSLDDKNILRKQVTANGSTYSATVIPQKLQMKLISILHDEHGHNGSDRTYHKMKMFYWWKGMQKDIRLHIRSCAICDCQAPNLQRYPQLHHEVPRRPMAVLAMDLIGPFPTGLYRYALTAICMLTSYVFIIPIADKHANTVVSAYMRCILSSHGSSEVILSDNGGEFRNKIAESVFEEIGTKRIHSAPYWPRGNSRVENVHNFIKRTLRKWISTSNIDWTCLAPIAAYVFNTCPSSQGLESPFFLMYGRDPTVASAKLFLPQLRYMGDNEGVLMLREMNRLWRTHASELLESRLKRQTAAATIDPTDENITFKEGQHVLVKNYTATGLDSKFVGDHRIKLMKSDRMAVVTDPVGKEKLVNIAYLKPASATAALEHAKMEHLSDTLGLRRIARREEPAQGPAMNTRARVNHRL